MYNETHIVKNNPQLRAMARNNLTGHWGMSILICFIYSIITGLPAEIPYAGWIVSIFIYGPLTLGLNRYFILLSRNEEPQLETLFDGFKSFSSAIILQLLITIFTILWSLLLIIPGIIASLSYSLSFYILNDNPQLSAMETIKISKEIMKGYKGKLFLMYLSFIGWSLLCIPTLGIGFLWLVPYIQASIASFYEEVKDCKITLNNTDYIEY